MRNPTLTPISDAKVTPFAFKRQPENKIASKGIENNYDKAILGPQRR